jgi:hypothetical protein
MAGFSLSLTLAVAFFLSNGSFSGISTPFLSGLFAVLMAQSETYWPVTVTFRHHASCPLTARKDSRREHWHPPPDDVCPAGRAHTPGTSGNDRKSRSGDA